MRNSPSALTLSALAFVACMDPDESGNLVPPTVEDDPSLPRIAVNGTTLHSEAFGPTDAPLVIMLHSGPGADYRYLLPYRALAGDGYRVVFWDQRGAGLSARHEPASYTFATYLEDLRQVIEHYTTSKNQKVIFFGQSWGAMYATWFINEHGDYGGRVTGAVLAEPGAFTSAGLQAYAKRSFPPWGMTSEELNDVAWSDQILSKKGHARADYLIQIAILEGFPREGNDENNPAPAWRSGAIANARMQRIGIEEGFDWTTNLRSFAPKVLFVRGDRNENMPLEHQKELASHYARHEMVTISGAGHRAVWEKQSEVLGHVRRYLAEVAPLAQRAQ